MVSLADSIQSSAYKMYANKARQSLETLKTCQKVENCTKQKNKWRTSYTVAVSLSSAYDLTELLIEMTVIDLQTGSSVKLVRNHCV